MKVKRTLLTGFTAFIILSALAVYYLKYQFRTPAVEEISSIKIVPFTAGGGRREELFFDLNKKEHLDMVNNILMWLKSGKIAGNAKDEMIMLGATPTYLIIELKNGNEMRIESSIGTITTRIPNRRRMDGNNIVGQVTVYSSKRKEPFRLSAPELKSFIENGWKDFFNYNKE